MQELARRRAEAARDALASQHGVDAARLALGEAAPEGEPGVVVELTVAGG
jgi:outer membrane protein OmpA-like peptidoglycan-associated protein